MRLPIPEREAIRTALEQLSPRDRRRYWLAVAMQFLLALLDLTGVLLLGAVGVLLASTAGETPIPGPVATVVDSLGLGTSPTATAALALGAGAAVVLISKSVLALLIQTRLLRFLGERSSEAASKLAGQFLGLPTLEVRRFPSQVTSYALIEGVSGLITGVLGSLMLVISELSLLTVLGLALLVIDPLTTVVAVAYFGGVALLLTRSLGTKARHAGQITADSNIAGRTVISDAVDTYPEVAVMGRREFFVSRFATERQRYASALTETRVLAAAPRYFMEAALVLGAALLAITLALTNDVVGAVGGIVLFLAASSRVVPSLLRLNTAVMAMRTQAAAAARAGELAERVTAALSDDGPGLAWQTPVTDPVTPERTLPAAPAEIALTNVSLRYPDRLDLALEDVTISVASGQSLALVGPTGAGKSSLVAVILGLVQPTSGTVHIGGLEPRHSTLANSGALGYVPQDVALVFGTVRDNVALGIPSESVDDERVWEALDRAQLSDFIGALPKQLDSEVGERGVRLSGGQRQRLGLARALYVPPQLLVLDEATSALDAETERAVAMTLESLSGAVTTVTVAHRLATIRRADVVAYIASGRLVAHGSFDEVRAAVPGFERQAQLLGM